MEIQSLSNLFSIQMGFGCKSPVTARLILFGLLWLTYHRNYELHFITFFCVHCGMAKEVYTGIQYLCTNLLKYRKTGRLKWMGWNTNWSLELFLWYWILFASMTSCKWKSLTDTMDAVCVPCEACKNIQVVARIQTMKLLQCVILGWTSTL